MRPGRCCCPCGGRRCCAACGTAPVDLDALAALVACVSLLAAAHPELAELELNPVLAGPSGVLALDAPVVRLTFT